VLALFASTNANAADIQWLDKDVGTPTLVGSVASHGAGSWTITGGGDDIWNATDNCHYLYAWGSGQTWDAMVEVTSFVGPDFWSKCELMVRASNPTVGPQGPDQFLAMMACQNTYNGGTAAENAVIDQFRSKNGGPADWKQAGNNPVPVYPGTWMGIHRNGSVFSIYYYLGASNPGNDFAVNWTHYFDIDTAGLNPPVTGQDSSTTWGPTPFPDLVAVGVAVTAHNNTDATGGIAEIANLRATFPAVQPPSAMGVTQPIQGVTTNVLGGEASLSFAATNNAVPAGTVLTVYQWYKNGTAVPGATNTFHTWLLDTSDNGAQYYCKAGCATPYTSVPQAQSATVTAKVLPGSYYTNGFKMEMFSGSTITRPAVEQGNVPPATSITVTPNCDDPGNYGNDYVTRVSGWFLAPASDNYTFFLAADDDSDLFLSTDNTIANKRLIAQETSWSGMDAWFSGNSTLGQKRSDQWVPDPANPGTPPYQAGIALTKGTAYYFEEVHHQGGGGGNFSATYQTAAMITAGGGGLPSTTFNDGTNSLIYAASNCMMYATIPATTLTWVTQPTNSGTTIGFPANFYSQAKSDSEFAVKYQWYKGTPGVAVAGGTTANLATANAVAGDDGAKFYVIATTAEKELSITSAVVSLQVFSPVLEKGWALDEYWYSANPGIAVFRTTRNINGVDTVCLTNISTVPDHQIFQPRMEGNSHGDAGSDFTERLSSYFYPPTTADYVFFVNSDDDSDLYVSTDATPGNARLVAQETGWSGSWQWLGVGGGSSVLNKCSATWSDAAGNAPWAAGIHLLAGQPYYIAQIHHEGGGGDNCEATYMTMTEFTASGNTGPANGQYSRFTGNLISSYAPKSFSVSFVQQPGTVTAPLGGLASLSAVAATDSKMGIGDNNDPRPEWNNTVVYQWTKNGVPIQGAVSSTYKFGPVSPQDSTIQFACAARAMGYSDAGNPLWVTSSVATIVVSGTPVYEPGFAMHQFWSANPGRTVIENNQAGNPTWTMSSPAFEVDVAGTEILDNFSDQLIGYFVPPTSGSYVFFCNSDDDADLFLSTDASASGRRLIAQETSWAAPLNWGATGNGVLAQVRSDTFVDPVTGLVPYASGIPLIAGQKYFMQMVHHQGGGGTISAVNAKLVSADNPAAGTLSVIRGSQVGSYVAKCTNVTFTAQPQSIAVANYDATTFTAGGTTDSTIPIGGEYDWRPFFSNFLQYQWYKNGTAVAGATTSALAVPTVLPTDNNATIYCTMRALGYADNAGNVLWKTSQVATITVNLTAPQLSYAATYLNTNAVSFSLAATNYITVAFTEPMDPVGLGNRANYTLPAGLTLLEIIVNTNNYRSVALAVSGTVTLPVNITVSSSLKGLGGGLAITGALTTAITKTQLADTDIGVPGSDPAWPGMMYVDGANAYTIAAEGSDIWGAADGFNFAYEKKTGDFDVVVRQKDIKHTSNWAKGGLMVRETLAADSRNWNIINDPLASDGIPAPDGSGGGASLVECNSRVSLGGASAGWDTTRPAPTYPNAWVRIKRVGNELTGYHSSDGVNWVLQGTQNPTQVGDSNALPAIVYVGICTTAHNNDTLGATFDQLKYLNVVSYDNYNSSYVVVTQPKLAYTRAGANLTISWTPTGGHLEKSAAVGTGAAWTTVGTANPATVPIGAGNQFFRVVTP